jgi:hypothetical protein
VAIAIEVTQDLSKLTLEDAGGRLRAAEDCAMEDDALRPPPHVDGKLLLTEEQWKEKMRQCSNAGQGSSDVTTSVITAGAPAIGSEITANQGRRR